jgi:hypothetical protein
MSKNLLWLFVIAAFVMPLGCSSDDDDDTPPPPAPWGPSAIAVGDDALIMVGSFGDTWTNVPVAESTIPVAGDLRKVVKIPNSNRLVAIYNPDAANLNASIYYNDNGGTGAWTLATYGTANANLDAAHVIGGAGGLYDEWELYDIMFLNSTEGYAVGSNYIILYTADAGVTWTDLNDFLPTGATTVLYQELTFSTDVPATFVPGATLTGATSATTGVIVAVNEYWDTVTVRVTSTVTTNLFDTTGDVTLPTAANITSVDNTDIWEYPTGTLTALFGLQGTPGTGTRGVHTLWFGTNSQTSIPSGIWKVVSNDPTGTAARTFTILGPDLGDQYATGKVGYYDINSLYFFDGSTGCAATDDGVFYTNSAATHPGLDYTQFAASDNDAYTGFAYSQETTAESGYLYSLSDFDSDNPPGRVAITYTGGATPTWSFGTTPTWVLHGTAANYSMYYMDDGCMLRAGGKIFVFEAGTSYSTGHWGFSDTFTDATMNNTLWTDTYEQYLGGTAANGDNPAYQKNIFATGSVPASGYYRWICLR